MSEPWFKPGDLVRVVVGSDATGGRLGLVLEVQDGVLQDGRLGGLEPDCRKFALIQVGNQKLWFSLEKLELVQGANQ